MQTYNYEKYLARALESVLNQTYGDFQLWIADNGSHDGTCEIIAKYAKADPRIVPEYRTGNKQIANDFLEKIYATDAEYFVRIDADDWVEEDYLEHCVGLMDGGADIVIAGAQFHEDDNPASVSYRSWRGAETVLTQRELLEEFPFLHQVLRTHWAKMMRLELLREPRLLVNQQLIYGSDTDFMFSYIARCRKIALTPKIVYHYYIHSNTMTNFYYEARMEDIKALCDKKLAYLRANGADTVRNTEFLHIVTLNEIADALKSMLIGYLSKKVSQEDIWRFVRDPYVLSAYGHSWKQVYIRPVQDAYTHDKLRCFNLLTDAIRVAAPSHKKEDAFQVLGQYIPPIQDFFAPADLYQLLKLDGPAQDFLKGDLKGALNRLARGSFQDSFSCALKTLLCILLESPYPSGLSWPVFSKKQQAYLLHHMQILSNTENPAYFLQYTALCELLWKNDLLSILLHLKRMLRDGTGAFLRQAQPLVQLGMTAAALVENEAEFVNFLKFDVKVAIARGDFPLAGEKLEGLQEACPGDPALDELQMELDACMTRVPSA
jgi:glycosyltransferase involved in cell wall biosynthesis